MLMVTTSPWANATPHLSDLYEAMATQGVEFRTGDLRGWAVGPPGVPGQRQVFHLNWLDHLASSAPAHQRSIGAAKLLGYLGTARIRRRHVWWTIHNVVPHDGSGSWLFSATTPIVFVLVGTPHFLSISAEAAFFRTYPFLRPLRRKALITPLPSSSLGLSSSEEPRDGDQKADSVTFLLFGVLRPAKNVVETIRSFAATDNGATARRLVVAGRALTDGYRQEIESATTGASNVDLRLRQQTDEELAALIGSADWGVFLYSRTSNSGALLIAINAGLPVMTSDLPYFAEVLGLDPRAGEIFSGPGPPSTTDWDRWTSLARSPEFAAMRQAARGIAAQHSPAAIASTVVDRLSSSPSHTTPSRGQPLRSQLRSLLHPVLEWSSRLTLVSTARARRYARMQASGGEHELRLVAARSRNVPFFDVGANAGSYTAMALQAGASAVHAIEPVPELAERLQDTFGRRVDVRNCALSAAAGSATLTVPVVNGVSRRTRASLEPDDNPVGRQFTVALSTLDSMAVPRGSMVKIDVEGHELEVMAGASDTLAARTVGTWLIEAEVRNQPSAVAELTDLMNRHGYTGWAVLPSSLVPMSRFSSARHQSPEDQRAVMSGGRRPVTYANNFCFVPTEDRDEFVSAAATEGFTVVDTPPIEHE